MTMRPLPRATTCYESRAKSQRIMARLVMCGVRPRAVGRAATRREDFRAALQLADLGVQLRDAGLGPRRDRLEEPVAELLPLVRVGREMIVRGLDPDLVQRRLDLLADLVALLGDHRDV